MSMHDHPFDDQSVSYGESIPNTPQSSLRSSNHHISPAANARMARAAQLQTQGVRDSASGSMMTSSSTYSEEE